MHLQDQNHVEERGDRNISDGAEDQAPKAPPTPIYNEDLQIVERICAHARNHVHAC